MPDTCTYWYPERKLPDGSTIAKQRCMLDAQEGREFCDVHPPTKDHLKVFIKRHWKTGLMGLKVLCDVLGIPFPDVPDDVPEDKLLDLVSDAIVASGQEAAFMASLEETVGAAS